MPQLKKTHTFSLGFSRLFAFRLLLFEHRFWARKWIPKGTPEPLKIASGGHVERCWKNHAFIHRFWDPNLHQMLWKVEGRRCYNTHCFVWASTDPVRILSCFEWLLVDLFLLPCYKSSLLTHEERRGCGFCANAHLDTNFGNPTFSDPCRDKNVFFDLLFEGFFEYLL